MPENQTPRVFVSYAHDSAEHKELVLRFATFLRVVIGLDIRLDRWLENRRVDWSVIAIDEIDNADFILMIASPQYKRRADGAARPDEGRGSQFEAAMIRNKLTEDLRRETERVLPVVLPGRSISEIPSFLNAHSTTRFEIAEISETGVAELISVITGRGLHPLPERGRWQVTTKDHAGQRILLAADFNWQTHSPDVRAQSATIDGVRYANSIVLLPRASIREGWSFVEVDLDGAFQRITSVVGVLDDAAEPFQVGHFRVCVDGTPWPVQKVALGKPRIVDVDITGARRVRLEMCRPGAVVRLDPTTPLPVGTRSTGLPELAWGEPAVF